MRCSSADALHNARLIPWAAANWRIVKRVGRLVVICNGLDTRQGVTERTVLERSAAKSSVCVTEIQTGSLSNVGGGLLPMAVYQYQIF
ncbi:hypothetical protein C4J84_4908 [Pseudomonas sp. R11-23-07]|nr:hypothetical protein C4J86_5042 [Pseudomonas sp. R2-7-07]AZF60737.1 hypothetical protein C4J84_4908 [Pseudomonas sp. R11-23-07]